MRIAVPTNDGTTISEHFGRSAAFLVFEIENGQIQNRETRTNRGLHPHDEGSCGHGSAGQEPHSHAGILSTLAGCDKVICAGMGWRAAEALKSAGIVPVVASAPGPAEDAVTAYLKGELSSHAEEFCHCRH